MQCKMILKNKSLKPARCNLTASLRRFLFQLKNGQDDKLVCLQAQPAAIRVRIAYLGGILPV